MDVYRYSEKLTIQSLFSDIAPLAMHIEVFFINVHLLHIKRWDT